MSYFGDLVVREQDRQLELMPCECTRCYTPMTESDFNEGAGFCSSCNDHFIAEDLRSTFSEVGVCH
jgi:hypothetical protein